MAQEVEPDYANNTYNVTARDDISALWLAIGEQNLESTTTVKVVGTINSYDIMVMNQKMPNLRYIDLSEANIVACDYHFYEGIGTKDNEMPSCAFNKHPLIEMILPESITYIGGSAFQGCKNLKEIVIPENVTSTGGGAFSDCTSLTSATMGDCNIGSYAFDGCTALKRVTIGECDIIGDYAFRGCRALTSVTIGECDLIGGSAFDCCSSLYNVQIEKVREIGGRAFGNCSQLQNIDLPDNLEIIGQSAFESSGLTSVDLPNSVKQIHDRAFYGSKLNGTVVFPENMTNLGSDVFYSCTISIQWNAIGETYYKGKLYTSYNNFSKYVDSFYSWNEYETEYVHKTTYSSSSYYYDYVIYCSTSPFDGAIVKSITFGPKVKRIPNNLLGYGNASAVSTISIPSSVKGIGNYAFAQCDAKDVYTYTIEPTKISENTFKTFKTANLHVPRAAYYNYYWAEVWNKFQKIIVEDGVEYEDFYLNNDYTVDENTGTVGGTPNVDMGNESGWIVETDDQQKTDTIFVNVDGNNSSSIITGEENLHANTVDVIIKLTLGEWQFSCFPYDTDVETQIEYDGALAIYEYDGKIRAEQGNNGWKRVKNGKIHKYKGYIIQGSKTADMHVLYNDVTFAENNENIALDFYGGNTPVDDGWNLIGNPYLSYYSIKDLDFDCPIMIWDKKNKTYRTLRGQDDDYRLAPFEGFFVQAPKSGMHVGFMKDFRQTFQNTNGTGTNKSAMLDDTSARKLINLTFTDGTLTDRTRVVFNESASSGYELGTDMAKTMSRDASAPQVYTVNDGIMYSINERPLGDSRVDVGVKVAKQGTYTFSAERADGPAILTDNATGATVDLSERSYEVSLESGTYNDRFTLNKSDIATGIENISLTDIDQNEEVDVYDIAGRLLKRNVTVGEVKKADKGVYILKGATSTYKVAVK